MNMPRWFRILKGYLDFQHGPTIPFLIGALRQNPNASVDDDQSRRELRALIASMRTEMPSGYGVVVEWCAEPLAAHILALRLGGSGLTGSVYAHDVHDDDSLAEALWSEYSEPIRRREFSRRADKHWHPFSDDELKKVRDVLAG